MKLQNKKAIVTGGSQGIGKGIAMGLANAGADVLIQYCSAKDEAATVVKEIKKLGRDAVAIQADFTEENAANNFMSKAIQLFNTADILVNCAAAYDNGPFLEIPVEKFSLMQKVNAETPFQLSQLFAKNLIAKNLPGSIINISSISGLMPSTDSCLNSCSKASLNMLTRCSALELAPHKIRVNSIAPGPVETESNENTIKNHPDIWQDVIGTIPLGRAGKPQDCSNIVVFLASDDASWITGAVIPCDGGMTISWQS